MEQISPPKDSAELVIRQVTPEEMGWKYLPEQDAWKTPNGSVYRLSPGEIMWGLAPPLEETPPDFPPSPGDESCQNT